MKKILLTPYGYKYHRLLFSAWGAGTCTVTLHRVASVAPLADILCTFLFERTRKNKKKSKFKQKRTFCIVKKRKFEKK